MAHFARHKFYYLTLAMVTMVLFAMNVLTTLKGDEYVYALIPGDWPHRCDTLADYVRSIPTFYQGTNGRLADAIERLFASLLGKPLFNVLNTAMFVLFVEGIFTIAVGRRRRVLPLALLLLALGVAFPYPGETMLWMAGSFNYLWSVTLTLWLVVWLGRLGGSASLPMHMAVLVCSLLVGWLNESTTMACLAGLAIYYLLNWHEFNSLRRTALVGQLLGLCLIVSSPALWHRLDDGNSVNIGLGLAQMVSRRILSVGFMSLRFVTPTVVAVLLIHSWRRHGGWPVVRQHSGYALYGGALLTALVLGMLIERPYTWLASVCLAIVLRSLWPWLGRLSYRSYLIDSAVALLFCAAGGTVALHKQWTYRTYDQQVKGLIATGPRQCVIPASSPPVSSRWIVPDVYDNTAYMCAYRTMYAAYYDKDNVQFLPPTVYERYTAGTLLAHTDTLPMVSDSPDIADCLLTPADGDYALIPLHDSVAPGNGMGKIYRTDMEQVWGQQTSRRRYWLGSLKEFVPFRPYFLAINGRNYLVVTGQIDNNVTGIELRFYSEKQWHELTFNLNK